MELSQALSIINVTTSEHTRNLSELPPLSLSNEHLR